MYVDFKPICAFSKAETDLSRAQDMGFSVKIKVIFRFNNSFQCAACEVGFKNSFGMVQSIYCFFKLNNVFLFQKKNYKIKKIIF